MSPTCEDGNFYSALEGFCRASTGSDGGIESTVVAFFLMQKTSRET